MIRAGARGLRRHTADSSPTRQKWLSGKDQGGVPVSYSASGATITDNRSQGATNNATMTIVTLVKVLEIKAAEGDLSD